MKSLELLPQIESEDNHSDKADQEKRVVNVPRLAETEGRYSGQERNAGNGKSDEIKGQCQRLQFAPGRR